MNFFNLDIDKAVLNNASNNDDEFKKLYDSSFVDLTKKGTPDRPLLSIGEKHFNGKENKVYVWTEGEMSAIVGPSKTKKTFLLTALIAAYKGGGSMESRFGNFHSHRVKPCTILHFDTEQGKNYAERAFRRLDRLTGINPDVDYIPFATRHLTAEQRVQLIDGVLKRRIQLYNHPIKLIAIDGIADLVDNTNDIVMSKVVSDYVMRWTHEYNLHVICVIHKNHGDNSKPVGHLGSFVVKKAETVFLLDRKKNELEITVSCDYSRGIPFEEFRFDVDDSGLPEEVWIAHSVQYQKEEISRIHQNSKNKQNLEISKLNQGLIFPDEDVPF